VGYSRWPRWTRARGLPAVAFATLDSTSREESRAEAERFGLACKWSRNRSRECPTELRRQRGLAPSKLDVMAGRCGGDGTVAVVTQVTRARAWARGSGRQALLIGGPSPVFEF
jgi:hypothetical protein